jgi:hypothetical protein
VPLQEEQQLPSEQRGIVLLPLLIEKAESSCMILSEPHF